MGLSNGVEVAETEPLLRARNPTTGNYGIGRANDDSDGDVEEVLVQGNLKDSDEEDVEDEVIGELDSYMVTVVERLLNPTGRRIGEFYCSSGRPGPREKATWCVPDLRDMAWVFIAELEYHRCHQCCFPDLQPRYRDRVRFLETFPVYL